MHHSHSLRDWMGMAFSIAVCFGLIWISIRGIRRKRITYRFMTEEGTRAVVAGSMLLICGLGFLVGIGYVIVSGNW